jgi:hypothetical protein
MTLNGTLIAQAINFCIAYGILRWLYFKPAVAHIQQEEATTTHIKNSIAERQLIIEQKQHQHVMYWRECQQYCQTQMPSVEKPVFVMVEPITAFEQPSYDKVHLKKMTDSMVDELVNRIDHVF